MEQNDVLVNGVYKHFKGKYYIVEGLATHSETDEEYVVYRALYGENRLFVRPKALFVDEVDYGKYPDASQKFRFELQSLGSAENE